jgi:hypothetical protein
MVYSHVKSQHFEIPINLKVGVKKRKIFAYVQLSESFTAINNILQAIMPLQIVLLHRTSKMHGAWM